MPNHPVLIVNPRSGNGRAAAIDLFGAAQKLGLETVTMQPGDDLAGLASQHRGSRVRPPHDGWR